MRPDALELAMDSQSLTVCVQIPPVARSASFFLARSLVLPVSSFPSLSPSLSRLR